MHSITLKVRFSAAHRVLGHRGKCRHLHGHSYCAIVTVTPTERTEVVTRKVGKGKKAGTVEEKVTHPPGLNDLGMVMDFADLKEAVKGWIDENWDHNTILKAEDPLVEAINTVPDPDDEPKYCYEMTGGRNATAESMAEELCEQVTQLLLDQFVRVTSVTIEETDGCSATFTPDDQGGNGGDGEGSGGDGDGDDEDEEDLEDDEDDDEDDGGKTNGKDKKAATHEEYDDDPELRGLSPR